MSNCFNYVVKAAFNLPVHDDTCLGMDFMSAECSDARAY